MSWTHGYRAEKGYTFGAYRELFPDWLDTAVIMSGCLAPQEWTDRPRYLELGCGQGVGLCMAAACSPEMEFVGIDFMPAHIHHGRRLARAAGLANVRFIEADLVDLADDWPAEIGTFEYVTMHGLYAWVPENVKHAIVRILGRGLAPGGIVHLSYNSMPGWAPSLPFQHILLSLGRLFPQPGHQLIEAGVRLFEQLQEQDAAMFGAMPALNSRLKNVKDSPPTYLVQEYLNEQWKPLWSSEVAAEFARAKLDYVGSATIPENFLPMLLPEGIRNVVLGMADPAVQRDLIDCAIMQSFRRDIFMRGRTERLMGHLRVEDLVAARLGDIKDPTVKIEATYGDFDLAANVFRPILDMLEAGPRRVGDLLAAPGLADQPPSARFQAVLLLASGGYIAIRKERACNPAAAKSLNRVIAEEAANGAEYRQLASPVGGCPLKTRELDLLALAVYLDQPDGTIEQQHAGLLARVHRSGRSLEQGENSKLGGAAEAAAARSQMELFHANLLPIWRNLGVVD